MQRHNIANLLAPGEHIKHQWDFHYLMGFRWFVLSFIAFLCAAELTYDDVLFIINMRWLRDLVGSSAFMFALIGGLFLFRYFRPFLRSYAVETENRMLVGTGGRVCIQQDILPGRVEDWQITQTLLQEFVHAGNISIRLLEGRQLRVINLPWVINPHSLVQHLQPFVKHINPGEDIAA